MTLASSPVLMLLAIHGIWLVICLIFRMFDFMLRLVLLKPSNDEILHMYLSGALIINVVYAMIMILHMVKQ